MSFDCDIKINSMRLNFLFVTILVCLAGCASKPVVYNLAKDEGQWEAKAQVRDLANGKTNTVNLEVMAFRDKALRMEVSGPMGVHVASFLLKGSEVRYAIHTQKRYFSGAVTERSMRPLLNASIDPRWLYSVFFDEELQGWQCKGQPIEICERTDGTKITWTDRQEEKKRIIITNPQFELQVLVKNFTTKVQAPEKAFGLEAPEDYKRYKLQ
jgi:hypothetical protein